MDCARNAAARARGPVCRGCARGPLNGAGLRGRTAQRIGPLEHAAARDLPGALIPEFRLEEWRSNPHRAAAWWRAGPASGPRRDSGDQLGEGEARPLGQGYRLAAGKARAGPPEANHASAGLLRLRACRRRPRDPSPAARCGSRPPCAGGRTAPSRRSRSFRRSGGELRGARLGHGRYSAGGRLSIFATTTAEGDGNDPRVGGP